MDKVLCLVIKKYNEIPEEELWLDLYADSRIYRSEEIIVPLIDLPHNDKETGQEEFHYHIDTRYLENGRNLDMPIRIPLPLGYNQSLKHRMLQKYNEKVEYQTSPSILKNVKFKKNCLINGKCPHKGYDLSNEIPDENGIITCPLHGLKFDTKDNNKLINH